MKYEQLHIDNRSRTESESSRSTYAKILHVVNSVAKISLPWLRRSHDVPWRTSAGSTLVWSQSSACYLALFPSPASQEAHGPFPFLVHVHAPFHVVVDVRVRVLVLVPDPDPSPSLFLSLSHVNVPDGAPPPLTQTHEGNLPCHLYAPLSVEDSHEAIGQMNNLIPSDPHEDLFRLSSPSQEEGSLHILGWKNFACIRFHPHFFLEQHPIWTELLVHCMRKHREVAMIGDQNQPVLHIAKDHGVHDD